MDQRVNGARRAVRRGLAHAARRGKASVLAEKMGLPVDDLVANVCEHFSQVNLPLDDMLTPEQAVMRVSMPERARRVIIVCQDGHTTGTPG